MPGRAGLLALLCAAALAPVPARGQVAGASGDPAAGRGIFVERGCVRCHAIWGNGGTLGPDLATAGSGASMQQLAGLLWNHTPRMMVAMRQRGYAWPALSEPELADVISYIYYVKLFGEPGDPDAGRQWFRDKRCVECHQVGDAGGRVGAPLDGYARYVAPIMLAQGMWDHGPAMQAAQQARGVPIPAFEGREMADIQAYIRRASAQSPRQAVLLEPPQPERGRRLFAAKGCPRCHGPEGRGTAAGPDLRAATLNLSVSQIAGVLWNHSFQMVARMRQHGVGFPQFAGNDMADLIAYLYFLRFNDPDGDRANGARIFRDKGCAGCHRPAHGPPVGPDLARSAAVTTPLGLVAAMWNHAPAMFSAMQGHAVAWPRFEGNEMRDLAFYLRSLARPAR